MTVHPIFQDILEAHGMTVRPALKTSGDEPCITCPRCKQEMADADCADGCDDPLCALIGGCK